MGKCVVIIYHILCEAFHSCPEILVYERSGNVHVQADFEFLGRSKVSWLRSDLAVTGCLNGQTAGEEVSKAMWITEVELIPALPIHQAASFSRYK